MLLFNKCIYGEVIGGYTGDIKLDWYSRDLNEVKTKVVQCNNMYQFNLGDWDLKGISSSVLDGESVRIYIDDIWSDNIVLNNDPVERYDIYISGYADSTDVASADSLPIKIISEKYIIEDSSSNMYSYFKVENIDTEVVLDGTGSKIEFIPESDGEYTITQRGYNNTNGIITEKLIILNVLEGYITTSSIDYVFYAKKGKVLQVELPEYVTNTLMLEPGWYYENGKLYGKHSKLTPLEMDYYNGKVVIKTQVGDILDY